MHREEIIFKSYDYEERDTLLAAIRCRPSCLDILDLPFRNQDSVQENHAEGLFLSVLKTDLNPIGKTPFSETRSLSTHHDKGWYDILTEGSEVLAAIQIVGGSRRQKTA